MPDLSNFQFKFKMVIWFLIICATSPFLAEAKPQVIISVLLDDFGYSSASFNVENPTSVLTPRLDSLAKQGIILRRHYSHTFCSPTRSSFLSGRFPVHVQMDNVQPDSVNAGVPVNMTTLPQKICGEAWVCHAVGKYDTGAATFAHTPEGRGFNSSLIYFSHAIDYFTHKDFSGTPSTGVCGDKLVDLWDSGKPAHSLNGTGYIDDLLLARILSIIQSHNFSSGVGLYIHYTPHVTHDPLQVTKETLSRFNSTTNDESLCLASINVSDTGAVFPGADPTAPLHCRGVYEATVSVADEALGKVEDALRAAGVWDNTVLVLASDNGGQPDLTFGGGNNFPLRGGKGSMFEGGFRTAAFLSGGYLPQQSMGTVSQELVHIADWYQTICVLALGSESAAACSSDRAAALSGLPAVDSVDVWDMLTSSTFRAHLPHASGIALSPSTFITKQWKLITGIVASGSGWSGLVFPNASSNKENIQAMRLNCTVPCLFDLISDKEERYNIAPQNPAIVTSLTQQLEDWKKGFYTNNESAFECDLQGTPMSECPCKVGQETFGGFLGPYAHPL